MKQTTAARVYENSKAGADSGYEARCIVKLQQLGLPLSGWVCEDVEDTESPEQVCELCGCNRVRFLHHMSHPDVWRELAVGCLCDGIMSGDELAAVERERAARNRAQRRYRFVHGRWSQSRLGYRGTLWEKKIRNGPKCSIRCEADGSYSVWHNGRWCYKCKGKPIASFEQAASALFTVNDPKRRTI